MPCEADYRFQSLGLTTITVQFLIYNEFEQRFSTSTKIRCFEKTFLSDIDTRPGPDGDAFSIFSVGTQGTLKGHSRIRSVAGLLSDPYDGRQIVGVLTEYWDSGHCVAGAGAEGATINNGKAHLCTYEKIAAAGTNNCPVAAAGAGAQITRLVDYVKTLDMMTCNGEEGTGCGASPAGNNLCGALPECTRTTEANIQVQGTREQGAQIILPGSFAQE